MKTFELLSIIGSIFAVGITLAAVVIGSNANLRTEVRTDIADVRTEMQTLRTEMGADIADVRTEMQTLRTEIGTDIADVRTEMQTLRMEMGADIADVHTDIRALEHRLAGVERRQARTEGLLEGLRDAIMARSGGAPPTRKEST